MNVVLTGLGLHMEKTTPQFSVEEVVQCPQTWKCHLAGVTHPFLWIWGKRRGEWNLPSHLFVTEM